MGRFYWTWWGGRCFLSFDTFQKKIGAVDLNQIYCATKEQNVQLIFHTFIRFFICTYKPRVLFFLFYYILTWQRNYFCKYICSESANHRLFSKKKNTHTIYSKLRKNDYGACLANFLLLPDLFLLLYNCLLFVWERILYILHFNVYFKYLQEKMLTEINVYWYDLAST